MAWYKDVYTLINEMEEFNMEKIKMTTPLVEMDGDENDTE